MKNFYSIINIAPNPSANESLAIGLIVVSSTRVYVRFSDVKLKIVKQLLPKEISVIEFLQKQIHASVNEQNKVLAENGIKDILFEKSDILNSDYFQYLNTYSNNLLQFSSPIEIGKEISNSLYNSLFELLVSNIINTSTRHTENEKIFKERIEKKLVERVLKKVHTHQKFNSSIIPALYFNYELDCIGLNGVFTSAKAINFEKSYQTIDAQLSHYFALTDILAGKYQRRKSENNFYLITDEPEDRRSKAHHVYKSILNQNKIKIISSYESEIVAEKIEATGAGLFLNE